MQELFSKLETEHPNLFNTNTIQGRQFINDYYQFFELEKKQIITAYNKAVPFKFGIEYYNETFKKNEQ